MKLERIEDIINLRDTRADPSPMTKVVDVSDFGDPQTNEAKPVRCRK
jgi:hypothetical protein